MTLTTSYVESAHKARVRIGITGPELDAQRVQTWLDKKGLVMAPKGQDFKVPKKAAP